MTNIIPVDFRQKRPEGTEEPGLAVDSDRVIVPLELPDLAQPKRSIKGCVIRQITAIIRLAEHLKNLRILPSPAAARTQGGLSDHSLEDLCAIAEVTSPRQWRQNPDYYHAVLSEMQVKIRRQ